jgi:hypothetical protein
MNLNELPGAELILPGLNDLHRGETNTVGALLVTHCFADTARVASTRLTEAGLMFPKDNQSQNPN